MFWSIISRISKHDKHQGTTHKDPQGNLTITVEAIESFLQNLKRLLKTQVFEEKATFPKKKSLCPIFVRIIECDEPQHTVYKVAQGIPTLTVEVEGQSCNT